ncbi:MAG: Hsp20 family protein [Hyphomonadaceae bacterium]|nr:Hsp20 family protein [Hyphomonadaceae bacterium]
MQTKDLSPLYRTLVGFDRINTLIDNAMRLDAAPGYPPFNVEQTGDDTFRIEVAVAGFAPEDLNIEFKDATLTVTGRKAPVEEARRFLHRGIAERSFERRFGLADYVRVDSARLENGVLVVELVRELPEAMKPRTIAINAGPGAVAKKAKTIDADAA